MFSVQKYYSVILLLIIVGLGLILIWDLHILNDIYWADEGLYLYNGRVFFKQQIDPAWGPFYSLWYYLLNWIEPNPIDLYHLNFKILIVSTSVALFYFLRSVKINLAVSFLLSILLLISYHNLIVWPKIAHFTFVIILLGFSIIQRQREKNRIIISGIVLSFILSYIRPEFFLTFILLFIYIIAYTFGRKKFRFDLLKKLIFPLIIFLIIIFFIGIPYSAKRSFGAFAQHYSFSKFMEINQNTDDPWLETEKYLSNDFGKAESIYDAVLRNHKAFLNHIIKNLKLYFTSSINLFTELLVPNSIIHLSATSRLFVVSAVFFLIIYIKMVLKSLKTSTSQLVKAYGENKLILSLCFVFIIPSIISSLVYYPRDHYLFIQYALFTILFLPLTKLITFKITITQIFIILIAFAAFAIGGNKIDKYFPDKNFKLEDEVRFVQKFDKKRQSYFLNRSSNLTFFLPLNFKNVEFDTLSVSDNISEIFKYDFIYINNRFKNSKILRKINLQNIIANATANRFDQYVTPGNNILLVKR